MIRNKRWSAKLTMNEERRSWPRILEIYDDGHESRTGERKLVATVKTDGTNGVVEVYLEHYRRALNALFTEPVASVRASGTLPDGVHYVAMGDPIEPWTDAAIAHVIEHDLKRLRLRVEERSR